MDPHRESNPIVIEDAERWAQHDADVVVRGASEEICEIERAFLEEGYQSRMPAGSFKAI
jgi:hypothetical protein